MSNPTLHEVEQEKLAVDRLIDESLCRSLDDRHAINYLREIRERQQDVADRIAALREREREVGER